MTPDDIVFDNDDYYIKIQVLERGDFNRDGLEDVIMCWTDMVYGGTYSATIPMVLTRYSADTPLVAIASNPPLERNCEPNSPLSKR